MPDRTANLLGALALAVVDRIEAVARDVLDYAGETPAAVVVIGYGPGMSNDKLRRTLGLSHPGSVRLVDRLAAGGLVERRPGPTRREVALHLTERGEMARTELLRGRLVAVRSLLEPLAPAEQEALAAILHKALAALKTSEMDRYTLCRLCDDRVCSNCPLPTRKNTAG